MSRTSETRSAGGVVLNKDGHVLVVSHRGLAWSLPKGHVEGDEDPLQTAGREIGEESGITQLEYVRELGTYQRYRTALDGGDDLSEFKTIDMFLFRTEQEALRPTDPDNPEARWVPPGEVADLLTHPKDKEFFRGVVDKI